MSYLRSRFRINTLAPVLAVVFLASLSGPPWGWTQATRIHGPEDGDVPMPSDIQTQGTSTEAAEVLLQSYLQAAGAGQWQGVQATGAITYSGNAAPPAGTATMTITREGFTRLDVTNSSGNTSLRIRGGLGEFQDFDGKIHKMPLRDSRIGLFAYPALFSGTLANQLAVSFAAQNVELSAGNFEKLSFTRPIIPRTKPSRATIEEITTDLYLSPSSHLLYKSVDLVKTKELSIQTYIRVITYEDYRNVDGVEIPFRYTETINGERSWMLQLNQAQPIVRNDPANFTF